MRASKATLLCLLPLLAAVPSSAQKIHIDFDQATPFSEYKTFDVRPTPHDLLGVKRSLHEHVLDTLIGFAEDGALTRDAENPDVYLAYYAAYYGDLELVLTDLEYAYGKGFSLGSYWEGGVGTREVNKKSFTFKEGTLVIDVWDAERKILVWRGMATAALKKDYERNEKKLEKALRKLMKQWEEMYGGRARALRKLKAESGG